MLRSWKASLACFFLVSFLAILTVPALVQADIVTYDFYATSYVGNFSLRYIDADGDGRFSLPELVDGSWSPDFLPPFPGQTWKSIEDVPAYDAEHSPLTDGTNVDGYWVFLTVQGATFPSPAWVWTCTQVPLPSSVFLLGAGLIGLAVARRKKRLGQ